MTTLHSLEIQGIRCFSPNNPQTIHFEKPLTLIVGQNGAGKTTIVECLKTVTSGILPPNCDRGKSFVHDSKLTENGDVRAQIKLTVETFSKDVVSATRKYNIVRDRNVTNKITFKSGETVLQIKPFIGEETTVSLKGSDMDVSMPSLMGLSRALIDSVIFCHQDENNWVLDDLAKVKARFDDLLETSRYTKALGALGKAKREQEDALNISRSQLEAAKAQMMQMADIKNQVASNMEDISKTKERISVLQNEVMKLGEMNTVLSSELEKVSTISSVIRDVTANIEGLTDDIKTLHKSMNEIYEEGVEDLQHFHQALTAEVENENEKLNNVSLKLDQLMDTMNELHQNVGLGKVDNRIILKETLKSTKETVESLKNEILKLMEMEETEFNETTVFEYMEQLIGMGDNESTENSALNECKVQIQQLEDTMLQLNTERSAKEFFLQNLLNEIDNATEQIKAIGDVVESHQQLDVKRQTLVQQLEQEQQQLQAMLQEKARLNVASIKLKNSIEGCEIENTNELSVAIKFLESILNNDRQLILTYLKDVMSGDIDEIDYGAALRSFFQKCLLADDNASKRKTVRSMFNTKRFQQDCVTAITQMIQSSEAQLGVEIGSSSPECVSLSSIGTSKEGTRSEPYNVLLKVTTNMRMAEYIEYFKSLLQQQDGESVNIDLSYEEILQKVDALNVSILALEGKIKELNVNLESLDAETVQLSAREEQLNEINSKLVDMELKKAQYTEEMKAIEESLEQTKSELQIKRDEYEQLSVQITSTNKSNALKAAAMSSLVDRYKEGVAKLQVAEQALEATKEEEGGDENIQDQISNVAESIKEKRAEQRDLVQSISNHRTLLENLQQNITLKLTQQQLSEANEQLDTLQNQLGNASEELLISKLRETNEMCAQTSLEIATLNGTLMTRQDNIAKLQQMLESDNYRYAQKHYLDTLVKLKAHTMAKEDLDIYIKNLEMGLHKFHSEKIAQINTVLKRVWREVYTGSHIDYIEIQSSVDTTLPCTAQAPKSYNYRMVMVTHNGTEMDMRGHCSAGERVLASLILRITLTETFCSNCNLLTLDEPTTNLDRDNIVSLEASLAKLVNECSLDFQLVIITHDEPFARKIAQRCNCDKYYKILKNERNESVINAIPFGSGFMT